jgi:hypothetical protein
VLIRRGTVVGVESIDPDLGEGGDDTGGVAGLIQALFRVDIEPAPGLDRTAADARRIVDAWRRRHAGSIMEFERTPDESVEAFSRRVSRSLTTAGVARSEPANSSTGD